MNLNQEKTEIKGVGRIIELITLFILIPVILALPIYIGIKLGIAVTGFIYAIYNVIKSKLHKNIFTLDYPSKSYIQRMLIVGFSIFIIGAILIYNYDASLLFSIVKKKPWLWIMILFIYSLLSVVPQEVIYRHFFFKRYEPFFDNKLLFLLLNMFCFALCHLFLWNTLVLILTFFGGGLFAYTYHQEKSMLWVCIEHTIYGYIIFTIGAGEMLAFPV